MLLDDYLPSYQFVERHHLDVDGPLDRVYAAARRGDLADTFIIRALLALRSLPSRLQGARHTKRSHRGTIDRLPTSGFVLLADDPPRELVIGVVGRFWTPSGGRCTIRAEEFAGFDQAGFAKAGWNFRFEIAPGGMTRVSTETRILCLDAATRRKFAAYWFFVRPFSGLIRIMMLRSIRRVANGVG